MSYYSYNNNKTKQYDFVVASLLLLKLENPSIVFLNQLNFDLNVFYYLNLNFIYNKNTK